MQLIQSIILGIVQGLSEFLPISSSAHLIILPWILNWKDQGLAFDVALHIGTLFAVIFYFRKEWMMMFRTVLSYKNYLKQNKKASDFNQGNKSQITNYKLQINSKIQNSKNLNYYNLFFLIILASIPGAIFGLLLNNYVETIFRSPILIVFTLSILGFFLWFFDKKGKKGKFLKNLNWQTALLIGFSQAFAIIPGISRSGITITMALALGFERRAAARFSFLLATPIIFGAGIMKTPQLINSDINFFVLSTGILTSAIAGFLAIKYILKYLENNNYNIFVYYRIIFALVILGIILMR